MKPVSTIILLTILLVRGTVCSAGGVCDDWVKRGGYCVDYVKSKIATFPVPQDEAQIKLLNNKAGKDVAQGDVAIFYLGNYWHVAFIEKVHPDQNGNPAAIDVSEMNFDGRMSLDDYLKKWGPKSENEWKRAVGCGVTGKFGQVGRRTNIPLGSVRQIWSPVVAASRTGGAGIAGRLLGKVRQAFNRFLTIAGSEL